jgi:hypothetical protein
MDSTVLTVLVVVLVVIVVSVIVWRFLPDSPLLATILLMLGSRKRQGERTEDSLEPLTPYIPQIRTANSDEQNTSDRTSDSWGGNGPTRSVGHSLKPTDEPEYCPYCKVQLPSEAVFCLRCGQRIRDEDRESNAPITSLTNRAGGVDVKSDTTTVGGDVVGRDKVTFISSATTVEAEQQRRIEATFPAQPVVEQIESLYVQVKMPESQIGSGARTHTIAMPFRAEASTGAALPTPFKIKVIAPGFQIYGGDEKTLRVSPEEDSTELEFQLKCETDQAAKIQVEVYAESGFLGQVELPVTPMMAQQIPAPSARMWIRGVFVLGALPNLSVSTASW